MQRMHVHVAVENLYAFAAGNMPKGAVDPFALEVLESCGDPIDGPTSKKWNVLAAPDAPKMDFVLTVRANAAGEACPLWPGRPLTAHWGIEAPRPSKAATWIHR